MIQSIWLSAAFSVLALLLLIVLVADHYGLVTLPAAVRPDCGPKACEYSEVVSVLLFITAICVALHFAMRLIRYLFVRD